MKRNNRRNYYSAPKAFNNVASQGFPPSTTSSFITNDVTVNGMATIFQQYRDYDIQVNQIKVSVAGGAPIFGTTNPTSSFTFNGKVGTWTPALDRMYKFDEFALLATIQRNVMINYWGIDFMTPNSNDLVTTMSSFQTWVGNVNNLYNQIKQAQLTTLEINTLQYQPAANRQTKWSDNMSPFAMLLLQYQTEILLVSTFVQAYFTLRSQLSALSKIYHRYASAFEFLQQELATAKFTKQINKILQILKRRFIDKTFYKMIVAPLTVTSKKNDGLNSPIIFLNTVWNIPWEPMAVSPDGNASNITPQSFSVINTAFIDSANMPTRDATTQYLVCKTGAGAGTNVPWGDDKANNVILQRTQNAWTVDTILDMVLRPSAANTVADWANDTISVLQAWCDQASKQVDGLLAKMLDFEQNPLVNALEVVLLRLTTAPGLSNMNWQQNTQFNEIAPISKFANWEMVNELALFAVTTPNQTSNGYTMNLPMFANSGLPAQLRDESFQAFYLTASSQYTSYAYVSSDIKLRFRDQKSVRLTINRTATDVSYLVTGYSYYDTNQNKVVGAFTDSDPTRTAVIIPSSYASLAFQDKFPAIKFIPAESTDTKTILTFNNPQLMGYVPVQYKSVSESFELLNSRGFIIPMA